jgi:hypothetical protein
MLREVYRFRKTTFIIRKIEDDGVANGLLREGLGVSVLKKQCFERRLKISFDFFGDFL